MSSTLDTRLAQAADVAEASQAVVDHLVAAGLAQPSVYLLRGDRMRIQAVHGYQQIFDGMPLGTGVIGSTAASGEPLIATDVLEDPNYLQANPSVRAEVCIPVRDATGEHVVAVVNVESVAPLGEDDISEVVATAASFEAQLHRLGHELVESPAQRLVRHALRLGALTQPDDIHAEVVAAARDVAGMSSAALLLPGTRGRFVVAGASGLLSDVLDRVAPAALQAVTGLVQNGCSCYTVGGTLDTAEELSALRAEGAEAVMAVPLQAGPDGRGVLLLADERPLVADTHVVELLELLAAHAASSLRTAAALEELRDRAATDPLTGLGHHATFHEAFDRARSRREAIAVLLADIDGFKAINDARGHQAGDRALRETAAALATALRRGDELFRIGGDEFAAIVRVADEREALDAGRRLRAAVNGVGELTISVGVALPVGGETDQTVIARADRALYEVKAAGRDGVALLS